MLSNTRLLLVSISSILFTTSLSAQDYTALQPSPNIGWEFSNINQNNDLYTGKVNISLPIYELQVGKFKLPLSLNYTTGSIAVDQLPSWVGLGWSLRAGGQVTRITRGKPDEMRDTKNVSSTVTVVMGGNATTNTTSASELAEYDFAYTTNYNSLNNSQWNTSGYLQNTLAQMPSTIVSANYIEWFTDYFPYHWITPNPSFSDQYSYDFEPDEYKFEVGSLSGSFYLAFDGTWKCETNQGNFKVEPTIVNLAPKGNRVIARAINSFKLTGPDGTKYYFGSFNAGNLLENIEFWRGPSRLNTGGDDRTFWETAASYYIPATPSVWEITKIETPENETIDFQYKKEGFLVTFSYAPRGHGTPSGFGLTFPGFIEQSLAEPLYLTTITASNGVTIDVNSTLSSQLNSNSRIDNLSIYSSFLPNSEIAAELVNASNKFLKLNSIAVRDQSATRKNFQFDYIENLTERLKLSKFKEVWIDGSNNVFVNKKYQFAYKSGLLPAYGSGKVDHFGYYNNRNPFFESNPQFSDRADLENQYYASREPDHQYSSNEVLEKITYPTGGYTVYEYEPNDYSSEITRWPFGTTAGSVNKTTGGIRISKISDYSALNEKASEKSYVYKSTLTGTLSTGVFSIPRPAYTEVYPNGDYNFDVRSFIPFHRVRSHITYTTVLEKYLDGSYTKFTYNNYDNGANDAIPFYESTSPNPAFNDRQTFTDNQFKRGLLKSKEDYNTSGQMVRKEEMQYQDLFDNYQRYTRNVRLLHNNQNGVGYKSVAYPVYYFPNFLRHEQKDLFLGTGTLSETQDYEYDSHNNLVLNKKLNSQGDEIRTILKYSYDFTSSNPASPYDKLVAKHIENPLIEEKIILVKGGQQFIMGGKIKEYEDFNGLVLPAREYEVKTSEPIPTGSFVTTTSNGSQGSLTKDNRYELVASFNKYDGLGRLREVKQSNEPTTVYLLGYGSKQVVAKIVNTTYDIAKTYVDQNILDNPANDAILRNHLNALRGIPGAFVVTYTYNPLVGMTSITDANNRTQYFEYDNYNRLSLIRDQDQNIIKKFCYNFSGQVEDCPNATNTAAQWRPTGQTRCQLLCPANNAYPSNSGEREEKDVNPASPTSGTMRWVPDLSVSCVSPPFYIQRLDLAYCVTLGGGVVGNYVIPTQDNNPCSATYGQFGQSVIIPNYPPCLTCYPACVSPQYKCISGVCQQGTLVVVKTRQLYKFGPWECEWAYCYPDNTMSSIIQTTQSSTPCTVLCN